MSIKSRLSKAERELYQLLNPPLTPEQKAACEYKARFGDAFRAVAKTMSREHLRIMVPELVMILKWRGTERSRQEFFNTSLMTREVYWQLQKHLWGRTVPLAMPEPYAAFLLDHERNGGDMKLHVKCSNCAACFPATRERVDCNWPYSYLRGVVDSCLICGGIVCEFGGQTSARNRMNH